MSALSGLEEQIAALMPAHKAREYRARLLAQRDREDMANVTMREKLAEAIEDCANAIRYPASPKHHIERALLSLLAALAAAQIVDQEDA